MVGVGNDDTFDVFDDAAAGLNDNLVRQTAKNLSGLGGAVSQRDGFRAAHGRDKLFFKNSNVGVIIGMILIHIAFSSFLTYFTVDDRVSTTHKCVPYGFNKIERRIRLYSILSEQK